MGSPMADYKWHIEANKTRQDYQWILPYQLKFIFPLGLNFPMIFIQFSLQVESRQNRSSGEHESRMGNVFPGAYSTKMVMVILDGVIWTSGTNK